MARERPTTLRRTAKEVRSKMKHDLSGNDIYIKVVFKNESINPSTLKNIRRFFVKSLPLKIKSDMNYDRPILYPLDYSYIKNPVSIDIGTTTASGRKKVVVRNTAGGIVIQYEYLGLYKHWHDTVKQIKKNVKKMVYSGTLYSKSIGKIEYSVSFQI